VEPANEDESSWEDATQNEMANENENRDQTEVVESGNGVRNELLIEQQTVFDCSAKPMIPYGISDRLEYYHAGWTAGRAHWYERQSAVEGSPGEKSLHHQRHQNPIADDRVGDVVASLVWGAHLTIGYAFWFQCTAPHHGCCRSGCQCIALPRGRRPLRLPRLRFQLPDDPA